MTIFASACTTASTPTRMESTMMCLNSVEEQQSKSVGPIDPTTTLQGWSQLRCSGRNRSDIATSGARTLA
eukprot:8843871-Prorocentrum_lima.AAC.1